MQHWKLQDAKNRFSEVVKRANAEGPQTVTVHGKPAAVVLSPTAYDLLTRPAPPFTDFLLLGPAWPDDLVDAVNDRARDHDRTVDL
jgi:prevent-host-death family protein